MTLISFPQLLLGRLVALSLFLYCNACAEDPPQSKESQRDIFANNTPTENDPMADAGSTTGEQNPPPLLTDSGVELIAEADAGTTDEGTTDIITTCEVDGGLTCEDDEDCSTENCAWTGMCYVVLGNTCDASLGSCSNPYKVHLPPELPSVEIQTFTNQFNYASYTYDNDGCLWPPGTQQFFYELELQEKALVLMHIKNPPQHDQYIVKLTDTCPSENVMAPALYCGHDQPPYNERAIFVLDSDSNYRIAIHDFYTENHTLPFKPRFHVGLNRLNVVMLENNAENMTVGGTRQLIPDFTFQHYESDRLVRPEVVSWTSSNPTIASIEQETTILPDNTLQRAGMVTALQLGRVILTATYESIYVLNTEHKLTAQCALTIGPPMPIADDGIGPCKYDPRIETFEEEPSEETDAGLTTPSDEPCDTEYEVQHTETVADVICEGTYYIEASASNDAGSMSTSDLADSGAPQNVDSGPHNTTNDSGTSLMPDAGHTQAVLDSGMSTDTNGGGMPVYTNVRIEDIQNCTTITGDLYIMYNNRLDYFELPNLEKVTGTFRIEDADALTSFSVPKLREIGGAFFVYRSDLITSFSAPVLEKVNSLLINSCPLLTGYDLRNLSRVDADSHTAFAIFENDALAQCMFTELRDQVKSRGDICSYSTGVFNNEDPSCTCSTNADGVIEQDCL